MHIAVTLIACIVVSYLFTLLTRSLNISVVILLILAGIILGSPAISSAVIEPNTEAVFFLGEIGVISLMFLAGMEISWKEFCEEEKDAALISVSATVIPFLMGFAAFMALGFSLLTSVTVGICMSITAEATNARVLIELRKIKTKIGSLMMGAGIIDDIMGIAMFVLASYFFLGSFMTGELLLIILAVIAFFAGMFVHKFIGREKHVIPHMEKFLMIFIIPFFFVSMGIHFSIETLSINTWLLPLIVTIAITGKIFGSMIVKPLTRLGIKQLYLIGWGMNSRGAVELAIAFVALRIGLLDTSLYTSLIIMALITTISFPFFIRRTIRKNPGIMD
jgi:Kef-type K+ transport system membrane component KefB